jgi:hypothetical protein
MDSASNFGNSKIKLRSVEVPKLCCSPDIFTTFLVTELI